MRKPYQPPLCVEAALFEDLKIGFPMIFSEANTIGGDRFHVGYNEEK